jgi:hypothetical protein
MLGRHPPQLGVSAQALKISAMVSAPPASAASIRLAEISRQKQTITPGSLQGSLTIRRLLRRVCAEQPIQRLRIAEDVGQRMAIEHGEHGALGLIEDRA